MGGMSDDPAAWLRSLADSMTVDPDLPPGVVIMKSGSEQVAKTASHPGGWNLYAGGAAFRPTFLEFIPNEPVIGPMASAFADEVEAFAAREATCGAVLFPLPDDPLTSVVIWAGEPVHPDIARQCGPVQGPRPAVCAREPHPDSPYHWDGKGAWWR